VIPSVFRNQPRPLPRDLAESACDAPLASRLPNRNERGRGPPGVVLSSYAGRGRAAKPVAEPTDGLSTGVEICSKVAGVLLGKAGLEYE
jgi:hypothetical protein